MTQTPRITAALIVQNEAANLVSLLPRLDWADEIVVVDGGSADGSAEVARSHGCRVFGRPFDTFARQRNFAIDQASSDWVLSIDADERPTDALVAEIRERLCEESTAAYHVPIRSTIFGRPFHYSGTQNDRPIRLFRREAARWSGDVHEVLQVTGHVGQLVSWLEHHTIPDLPAFLTKMDRYTALEAAARVAAGRCPRRRDKWIAPAREVFRRLIWKKGFLDGPAGWAFCLLSGLSEWVLAKRHERGWSEAKKIMAAEGGWYE
jgi:glycosyltransferase involved in cell wall biosynthesis